LWLRRSLFLPTGISSTISENDAKPSFVETRTAGSWDVMVVRQVVVLVTRAVVTGVGGDG
jgi:hypothetical protein